MSGADIITAILLAGILIAVIVYLLYWLYRRSSKEIAFVRTGLGGERVVITGGALVLPIVHNITMVGMNTLRLEVRRSGERALITSNRMRVDVVAEFSVRVKPEPEWVSFAAQTLGPRTMDPETLKEVIQGRFVDALSTVAAQMTMDEMQEKRGAFVQSVKGIVEETLVRNGLELETVSLTGLDQTSIEQFNPNNAFDAEGLTQLTEQIEKRKKVRNDIEQDTLIAIRAKNLEAEIEALDISKRSEYARLEQERQIAQQRALERTQIAADRAQRDREAQEAEISAAEEIEKARIQKQKAVEAEQSLRETTLTEEIEERRRHRNDVEREAEVAIQARNMESEIRILELERETEFARLQQQEEVIARRARRNAEAARQEAMGEQEAETARIEAVEAVERARIAQERILDADRVLHQQETEKLEIVRRKILAVEEQDRAITILRKEKEKAAAQAETEEARARAVEAEERVASAREREIAERRKLVDLIEAARAVESEALQLTIIAQAQTTAAEQKAAADRFSSLAAKLRYEVDAQGKLALNEAENARSEQNRYHALRMNLLDHLEGIVRESVRPMENIGEIKILQVDGLPGLSGLQPGQSNVDGAGSDLDRPSGRNGSLADNIVSAALRYRAQVPFVDTLLQEIGMSPGEISKLGHLLNKDDDASNDGAARQD